MAVKKAGTLSHDHRRCVENLLQHLGPAMKNKPNPVRAWAVFYPDGYPLASSVAVMRKNSIFSVTSGHKSGAWKALYRNGFRVRRVKIIVEE